MNLYIIVLHLLHLLLKSVNESVVSSTNQERGIQYSSTRVVCAHHVRQSQRFGVRQLRKIGLYVSFPCVTAGWMAQKKIP
jgi:hypothetical protein